MIVDQVFRDSVDTIPQDWQRISRWFANSGRVFDWNIVRQYSGGISNLNYLAVLDEVPIVFRCPPSGVLAKGASDVAREWRILSRLHENYPLAPRGIAFCGDTAVIGKPFEVIERKIGIAVGSTLPTDAPKDMPSKLTTGLINVMCQLHRLDPRSVGLAELGHPEGFLQRQIENWTQRGEVAWGKEPPRALRHLSQRLRRSIPKPVGTSLLHMDLKFDNLLVDASTISVQAVIDWDMATRGCPLFDLAVLLSYWIQPDDPPEVHALQQLPSLTKGFESRQRVAGRYFATSEQPQQSLSWYLACARLRVAVAWMQLYRLWEFGALVGERYERFPQLALAVLNWAADSLDVEEI